MAMAIPGGGGAVHGLPDPGERRRIRAGGNALPDLRVEEDEAGAVVLPLEEVGDRCGERAAVLVLAEEPASRRASRVTHGLGTVEEDVPPQVRLLLEALEDDPVGAAEHLPVDVPRVIARDVGPVLAELHGLAVVGAPVHARDDPLDDHPGAQLEAPYAGKDFRIVESFVARHRGGPHRRRWG